MNNCISASVRMCVYICVVLAPYKKYKKKKKITATMAKIEQWQQ